LVSTFTDSGARLYHQLSSYDALERPSQEGGTALATEEHVRTAPADPELVDGLNALLKRRISTRDFGEKPLARTILADVLWSGYGCIDAGTLEHRTVPSAGGLYPLDVVVAARNIDGLASAWHQFCPADVTLKWLAELADLSAFFRTQHVPYEKVSAVVFLLGNFDEPYQRYGERGYRFVLLEAGHVAQNLLLACAARGVGAIALGGFEDELTREHLAATLPNALPLYAVAIGTAAEATS
jgi:SagB-type dehydrogenase family enzyme